MPVRRRAPHSAAYRALSRLYMPRKFGVVPSVFVSVDKCDDDGAYKARPLLTGLCNPCYNHRVPICPGSSGYGRA